MALDSQWGTVVGTMVAPSELGDSPWGTAVGKMRWPHRPIAVMVDGQLRHIPLTTMVDGELR